MIRIDNTQYCHFLQQADALRSTGSLCDAVILVKSQPFRAHRLVLTCASKRLGQHLSPAEIGGVVTCSLDCLSPHTFQQVLDFVYAQALEVSLDDLHLLLRAARLLGMQQLEEQCWKQLDNLPHIRATEASRRGEITNSEEEQEESKEDIDQKPNGSPAGEKKPRETSSLGEEASGAMISGDVLTSDPDKNQSKKPRPRDSVITRPGGSSSSSSLYSPWSLPTTVWDPVSTLRRIAENYSHLMTARPLHHYPNQSPIAYPFSLSTPHVVPLLGSHLQSPAMGFSGFCRYTTNLYAGSTGMRNIVKQGLLKRKRTSQSAFTGTAQTYELSCNGVPKASPGRVKDCRHCKTSILHDPVVQESTSTPTGEDSAGCQFCGKGDVTQREPQSGRQEHRGEKPYQCKHCPKTFSLKHQLDTHHRVHTGEKPFECRLCGQRSRDYSAMIKHLRTHGGASPYQCTVCLEFCSSLVAMQRHVKGHAAHDFPPDWTINSTYMYTSHI